MSSFNQYDSLAKNDSMESSPPAHQKPGRLPRFDVNPRNHKVAIFFHIFMVFLTSCLIPEAVFFTLTHLTTIKLQIILGIVTPIFGVVSLFSLFMRTWRLLKSRSNFLPLGQKSRLGLDYFDWNFIGGFCAVSALITAGISLKPSNLRIVALPLPLLLLQVCLQMLILIPVRALNLRAPFRFSSIARGDHLRPAAFVIAEDVVAVDAKQGIVFREQWNARYDASPPFRTFLGRMDWMWGLTGTLVAGGCIAVSFGVKNTDIGWAVCKFTIILINHHSLTPSRLGCTMGLGRNHVIHNDQDGAIDAQAGGEDVTRAWSLKDYHTMIPD